MEAGRWWESLTVSAWPHWMSNFLTFLFAFLFSLLVLFSWMLSKFMLWMTLIVPTRDLNIQEAIKNADFYVLSTYQWSISVGSWSISYWHILRCSTFFVSFWVFFLVSILYDAETWISPDNLQFLPDFLSVSLYRQWSSLARRSLGVEMRR